MLRIVKSTLEESTIVYTSMLSVIPLSSETSLMTAPFQRFPDVVL